uniref:metal-dependent hydrolase n=1 Tax=Altererythrobacter segetis TaxID=1104773 RepID=UPI001408B921|nr:metal-dependent hydrolase [Altererythrobacter segetis]
MDNITHSLVGWTLAQTGLKRKSRKGLAALILGANAPDIDVFLGWAPWPSLATHRGWTHSFFGGVLVLPLGLAGLLWLLDRWQQKRGQTFKSGLAMHFGWLVALSYIGCLTHPLLDWQTSYAIQLFAPFDKRWYHNDSLFILDVWIWLGLGLAIWLSRRREARGRGDWGRPAVAASAALLFYITANGALTAHSYEVPLESAPRARPEVMIASPPPLAFWRRNLIWRQQHAIWRGDYDPLVSFSSLTDYSDPLADGMTDPLARRVLRTRPDLARFRRWSIVPMAAVERHRCYVRVTYQDARFGGRPGTGRLGQSAAVATGAPGC